MAPLRLKKLLLASAKGKVLDLLRGAPHTADELAASLGVTGNAVRSHLVTLERDGLVQRGALRRTGARRPSHTYRLAPGAESLFSRAYIPFLDELLHVLVGTMPLRELEGVIRTVGRRLAAPHASQPLASRVEAAAALLDELGGITEVRRRGNGGGSFVIHGVSCPLDAVVRSHPEVCIAIESLVAEMTRAYTREQCHRAGDQPHCEVEVAARGFKPQNSRRRSVVRR